MAYVLRNAVVQLDGTDISTSISQVEVAMTAADVNVTAMGAGGQQHLAGIRDDSFTFTAFSAFGASTLHSVVNAKFVAAGTLEVIVFPSGSTAGTLNPKFIGYCPLLTYTPVGGAVGDAATTPLTLPVNGTITVATS
jgi:hypothetical protein